MRVMILLAIVMYLISCGTLIPSNTDAQKAKKISSARRADQGKYLIDQNNVVGRRSLFVPPIDKKCLNSSRAVSEYLAAHIPERNQDVFLVSLLDEKNQVLSVENIGDITLSSPEYFSPEVLQKVSEGKATSVILIQNQPSRSSSLYRRDREISKSFQLALNALNVKFLDHLIISKKQCFSFADHRLL